jgi:hypothetical protein
LRPSSELQGEKNCVKILLTDEGAKSLGCQASEEKRIGRPVSLKHLTVHAQKQEIEKEEKKEDIVD